MNKYTLNTDGGSRGNPGPAGIGCLIKDSDGQVVSTHKEYIGEGTNNFAEYSALIKGLELALENNISDLSCFLDSELVVKQLNGQYKVKNPDMKVLYDKVISISGDFESLTFSYVPRSQNAEADKLVNQALDAAK